MSRTAMLSAKCIIVWAGNSITLNRTQVSFHRFAFLVIASDIHELHMFGFDQLQNLLERDASMHDE